MTCINCGAEVPGKFCGECGQPMPPKRINLKQLYFDFQTRIYGLDGMFPRTLRDLTIRPGRVADAYIDGNRRSYYGPVGYFFLIATVMYLLADLIGISLLDFLKGMSMQSSQGIPAGSDQEKLALSFNQRMSENLRLFTFIQIPIWAFASKYVFFRKVRLNWLEHAILPLYVHGHFFGFQY